MELRERVRWRDIQPERRRRDDARAAVRVPGRKHQRVVSLGDHRSLVVAPVEAQRLRNRRRSGQGAHHPRIRIADLGLPVDQAVVRVDGDGKEHLVEHAVAVRGERRQRQTDLQPSGHGVDDDAVDRDCGVVAGQVACAHPVAVGAVREQPPVVVPAVPEEVRRWPVGPQERADHRPDAVEKPPGPTYLARPGLQDRQAVPAPVAVGGEDQVLGLDGDRRRGVIHHDLPRLGAPGVAEVVGDLEDEAVESFRSPVTCVGAAVPGEGRRHLDRGALLQPQVDQQARHHVGDGLPAVPIHGAHRPAVLVADHQAVRLDHCADLLNLDGGHQPGRVVLARRVSRRDVRGLGVDSHRGSGLFLIAQRGQPACRAHQQGADDQEPGAAHRAAADARLRHGPATSRRRCRIRAHPAGAAADTTQATRCSASTAKSISMPRPGASGTTTCPSSSRVSFGLNNCPRNGSIVSR